MKSISYSNKFPKDLKKVKSQKGYNEKELMQLLTMIQKGEPLPQKYRDHKMVKSSDDFYLKGSRDFHLKANICVVYRVTDTEVIVLRIGSHSELGLTENLFM